MKSITGPSVSACKYGIKRPAGARHLADGNSCCIERTASWSIGCEYCSSRAKLGSEGGGWAVSRDAQRTHFLAFALHISIPSSGCLEYGLWAYTKEPC